MKKIFTLNGLLYMALVTALYSSLSHVAFAISSVNGGNMIEAYASAIAIDLGLLALAAGIMKRKKAQMKTKMLWGGVILFSIISTYANWLSAVHHMKSLQTVDIGQFGNWLISIRPILLSGILPILVIYLSEVLSNNYQIQEQREKNRLSRQAKKTKEISGKIRKFQKPKETVPEPMVKVG